MKWICLRFLMSIYIKCLMQLVNQALVNSRSMSSQCLLISIIYPHSTVDSDRSNMLYCIQLFCVTRIRIETNLDCCTRKTCMWYAKTIQSSYTCEFTNLMCKQQINVLYCRCISILNEWKCCFHRLIHTYIYIFR